MKNLVAALVAVVVLFVSVGCDSPTAPPEAPTVPPPNVSYSLTIEVENTFGSSGMNLALVYLGGGGIIYPDEEFPMTLSSNTWGVTLGEETLSKMAEAEEVAYLAHWQNKVWTAEGLAVTFTGTTTKSWVTDISSLYLNVAGPGRHAAKMRVTNGGTSYSIMQICPGGGVDSCPTPS